MFHYNQSLFLIYLRDIIIRLLILSYTCATLFIIYTVHFDTIFFYLFLLHYKVCTAFITDVATICLLTFLLKTTSNFYASSEQSRCSYERLVKRTCRFLSK